MKQFKTYFTEYARTYKFRIRLACEAPDDMISKLKLVLEEFRLDSMTKPRRLPIQESPIFPNVGPTEINIIDVELGYPTTDEKIRSLISEAIKISDALIRVTPADSPYEAALAGEEQSNMQKEGVSVLATPEMEYKKPDEPLAGTARMEFLINEIKALRGSYEIPAAEGTDRTNISAKDMPPVGTVSPMGSHQNKIPVVKK